MGKHKAQTEESIIWPITPGWKADQHRLDDPEHVAEARAWAASIFRPMAVQRAIEAAARAEREAVA